MRREIKILKTGAQGFTKIQNPQKGISSKFQV